MAICLIQDFPPERGNPELYDSINEKLGFPEVSIDGLIAHSAGQGPNGWRIVDFWESREHADRFFKNQLFPAIKEVTGVDPMEGPPPETQEWELHNVYPS